MKQKQETTQPSNFYKNPEEEIYGENKGRATVTLRNALESLMKRLSENTKRWLGKKQPDNVKEERRRIRQLISSIQKTTED